MLRIQQLTCYLDFKKKKKNHKLLYLHDKEHNPPVLAI